MNDEIPSAPGQQKIGDKRHSAPHLGPCGICGSENICEHDLAFAKASAPAEAGGRGEPSSLDCAHAEDLIEELDREGLRPGIVIDHFRRWREAAQHVPAADLERQLNAAVILLRAKCSDQEWEEMGKKFDGLAQHASRGRWISVAERLPDDGSSAIIFVPEWEDAYLRYRVAWIDYDMAPPQWIADGGCVEHVTHWMPLPKPPEPFR